MADRTITPALAGVALVLGVVWLLSSKDGQAKVGAQLDLAAHAGAQQAGLLGSMSVKTGITPVAWKPYVPPGAHMGAHRMYHHPGTASPHYSHLTTAPDAYDWMFCPPSEEDL